MNHWAKSAKYDCNFLCICVLGDRSAASLAREMSNQSQLTHCVNGFIDNNEGMPEYGQLGCQGFIILDDKHQVVSSSTSAFMQVRDIAFKHVETLLGAVCAGKPPPRICPGEFVQLTEAPADQPRLRGQQAICVASQEDMLSVVFLSGPLRGKQAQVPAASVAKLDDEEDSEDNAEPGRGGCGGGGCSAGGCNAGGCSKQGCNMAAGDCDMAAGDCDQTTSGRQIAKAFIDNALDLVSVKVPSMDAEHEECAEVLRRLADEQSRAALQAVISCLSEHFAHEEALFEEFGFGGNERFSAKKTHIEDHRRITGKMQKQLAESTAERVPAEFIEEVLQDFHEHTSRYDIQYAELMSSQGAK